MTDNRRAGELVSEIEELIAHPRAAEILLNVWLHDDSLSAPSCLLIQYLAFRLLTSSMARAEAGASTREEMAEKVIAAMRQETPEELRQAVARVLRNLECYQLLGTGKAGSLVRHTHEWRAVLWPFLFPGESESESVAAKAGDRALARAIIETMVMRAVFTWDAPRIEGLAEAMRQIRDNKSPKAIQRNRIAGEVMRWLPYLSSELSRQPSRSEMKEFLMEKFQGEVNDKPADWSAAWKIAGYPADGLRKRRVNSLEMVRLARRAPRD